MSIVISPQPNIGPQSFLNGLEWAFITEVDESAGDMGFAGVRRSDRLGEWENIYRAPIVASFLHDNAVSDREYH